MKVTTVQVDKLLKQEMVFTQFGFAMLIGRLRGIYAKDSSNETLQGATDEVNRYIDKFQSLMMYDFDTIKNL